MRKIWNLNKNWYFKFDGEEAFPVTLPHDWMISRPFQKIMKEGCSQGFRDRWGIGWYRRSLTVKKQPDIIYRLRFDGIYENSTVWVNGIPAGGRKYGYSSFDLDVTEYLRDGDNEILVKADNTASPVDRWYTGAGIYRNVSLECLPKEHLEQEHIQVEINLELPQGAETEPRAELVIHTGVSLPVKAKITVEGKTFQGISREGLLILQASGFELWSAEHPKLYELQLQLFQKEEDTGTEEAALDVVKLPVGFRKAELFPDKGLFVNGEPVKLKGVCVHQDAGCFGTAVTKEIWKERLLELKEIGCNAVRLAHHLYMPQMLELCDELGFYVYEEAFDKWTGGAYGRYYETEWERDLACMVKRDRNHPCILFWGVGNEVENQAFPSMLELLERHVKKVKEYDCSRPVSLAMNPHFAYPENQVDMSAVEDIQQFVDEMKTGEIFDVDDRIAQIAKIARKVDFLSCNYQEQWYQKIHEAVPDKAILGTETYMYFRGYEEKFQNFTDRNPWFDVVENDFCIGGFIWTGIDYLGESMGYPAKGWSGALFAIDMEKRPIAWQIQSYWTREPMVRFAVLDGSLPDEGVKEHWDAPRYVTHWEFPQFQRTVLPYMIATNCEEVELHVNEKEYAVRPAKEFSSGLITGFLPYFPGEVTVIGKNGGKEVCRHTVRTPGAAVKLSFEKEEQTVRLSREKTDSAEVFGEINPYQILCKVRAYDGEENPVFRESAKVVFTVEGPAQIIGVENGDIKSAEPADNDFIHLYYGRADVALRITAPGRVKVTAYAAGLKAGQSVICAVEE